MPYSPKLEKVEWLPFGCPCRWYVFPGIFSSKYCAHSKPLIQLVFLRNLLPVYRSFHGLSCRLGMPVSDFSPWISQWLPEFKNLRTFQEKRIHFWRNWQSWIAGVVVTQDCLVILFLTKSTVVKQGQRNSNQVLSSLDDPSKLESCLTEMLTCTLGEWYTSDLNFRVKLGANMFLPITSEWMAVLSRWNVDNWLTNLKIISLK